MLKQLLNYRWILVIVLASLFLTAVLAGGGIPVAQSEKSRTPDSRVRTVTLTAKNGKYLLNDRVNPTLRTPAGETLNLVFKNTEPGVTHAIAIPDLSIPNRRVPSGENTVITITPTKPGTYKYICPHHLPVMQGKIVVTPSSNRTP